MKSPIEKGTVLAGQYHIAKRVAENDYAIVFKAHDLMADARPVAIKVAKFTSEDGVALELFRRELDSLSRLRHQHIVRLMGSQDDHEHGPWLALEWMDGGSLAAPDVRARLTGDAQLLILRAMLDALSFAHFNHVLHRDIKPANILFTAEGTAKLADFNVAKILQRATATRTVKHIFTAEYAAPEQSASRIVTERSDVYSLGKVFVELATAGRATGEREMLAALDAVPLRGPLKRLLKRMMAQEATDRPTALEALREADALLASIRPTRTVSLKASDSVLKAVAAVRSSARTDNEQRVAIEADLGGLLLVKASTQPSPKGGTTYTVLGRRLSYFLVTVENDFGEVAALLLTSAAERDPAWEERERKVAVELPMTCRVAGKDTFGDFRADAAAFVDLHRQVVQGQGTASLDNQQRKGQLKSWRDYIGVVQELRQREGVIGEVLDSHERDEDQLLELKVRRVDGLVGSYEDARIAYQPTIGGATVPLGVVIDASASTFVVRPHDDFHGPLPLPNGSRILLDGQQEAAALRRQIQALNTLEDRGDTKGDLLDLVVFPERVSPGSRIRIVPKTADLAPENQDVVEAALGTERLFLVQGPPGTGKTTVITELVAQILSRERGSRILLVSQANVAVDNVLERLPELVGDVPVVRLGRPEKVAASVRHMLLDTRLREEASAVRERASMARGLLDTLPKNAKDLKALSELWALAQARTADRSEVRRQAEELLHGAALVPDADLEQRIRAAEELACRGGDWQEARGDLQEKWIDRLRRAGELETILFANMRVVAGTCVGVIQSRVVAGSTFDWVIVDEAGRASGPELLVPLVRADRIVLVGDHRQLPPILDREALDEIFARGEAERAEFERSLFETLFGGVPESARISLTRQYRMHPVIAGLIEECFYPTGLGNGVTAEQRPYGELLWQVPLRWLDTSELQAWERLSGTSYTNPEELRIIAHDIRRSLRAAADAGLRGLSIGVLTGYARQVEALEDEVSRIQMPSSHFRIEVLSVDAAQGKQFDLVYYSAVRANRQGRIGFLQDERRLNVALSRAKHGLTIVGHLKSLMEADTRFGPNPFLNISRYFRTTKQGSAILTVSRNAS